MKKWEYQIIRFRPEADNLRSLNDQCERVSKLGSQGWKVISTESVATYYIILLEREIPEPSAPVKTASSSVGHTLIEEAERELAHSAKSRKTSWTQSSEDMNDSE